jgi:hypothetical protein
MATAPVFLLPEAFWVDQLHAAVLAPKGLLIRCTVLD